MEKTIIAIMIFVLLMAILIPASILIWIIVLDEYKEFKKQLKNKL